MPGWFKRRKGRVAERAMFGHRPRGRGVWRACAWLVGLAVVAAGTWEGLKRLERYAVAPQAGGAGAEQIRTVRVAYTSRPEWMPLGLARDIAVTLIPPRAEFGPEDLSANVYRLASTNPHIAEVRRVVRHSSGEPGVAIVEIDCRFRMPVARVDMSGSGWGYAFVDREGYRLPEADVPQWTARLVPTPAQPNGVTRYYRDGDALPDGAAVQAVHYVTIRGIKAPAPDVGKPWEGSDIQDALRLVSLVLTRSYANQISVVDVRNHDGRISQSQPHLRLYAQVGNGPATDIRFGRFPAPGGGDYEVTPEVKMSHLDDYFLDHGRRLAGLNSYIDLQYDQLIYSMN